ncbi:MAG TPA: D-alanine--D-alanine ligase, partial [Kiritimatiellia bacterium]
MKTAVAQTPARSMAQKRFQHVAVLMGGPSAEREVSLRSGAAIAKALRGLGYEVDEVDITTESVIVPKGVEAAFIALHGTFGEDGSVQALLEKQRIPYTGSDVDASRAAFDKIQSKRIFEKAGIPTPRYEILNSGMRRTLPLPVVVKPPRQGSSIGVSKVETEEEWEAAVHLAERYDTEVLVEAFIDGRELTVGVVGEQVLPAVEIRAPEGQYNYHAKYTKGVTEYLCPAPIDEETARRAQQIAWDVFAALNCRGMGRVDFRLAGDGSLYVLELNSIPGFT